MSMQDDIDYLRCADEYRRSRTKLLRAIVNAAIFTGACVAFGILCALLYQAIST